jgi:hypothetical protein
MRGDAVSVQPVERLTTVLFAAVALLAGGCGDESGDERLGEGEVQDCLADEGFTATRPAGGGGVEKFAPLSGAVPDFVLYAEDGTSVGVSVYGSVDKAERAAADLAAALQGLGGADPREVISEGNVVVTFGSQPSVETREAVQRCTG